MGHWKLVICVLFLCARLIHMEADQVSTSTTLPATSTDAPSCPEEDLHVIALRESLDTITVSWNSTDKPHKMIVELEPSSTDPNTDQNCRKNETTFTDIGQVVFHGCCPDVDYKVVVILRCIGDEKRYSVNVVIKLDNETTVPELTKIVQVFNKTNNSVSLSWKSFQLPVGFTPIYKIQFQTAQRYNAVRKMKRTNNTWITVDNLLASTEYCFLVSVKLKKWKPVAEDICTRTEDENVGHNIMTTHSPTIEPCSTERFQQSGLNLLKKIDHSLDYSLEDGCSDIINDTENTLQHNYDDEDFKTESSTTKSFPLNDTNQTPSNSLNDNDEIQDNVISYRFGFKEPKNVVAKKAKILSKEDLTTNEPITISNEDLTITESGIALDDLTSNVSRSVPNEDSIPNVSRLISDEDLITNVSRLMSDDDLATTEYRIISGEDLTANESEIFPTKNLTENVSDIASENNFLNTSESSGEFGNFTGENSSVNNTETNPDEDFRKRQSRIFSYDESQANQSEIHSREDLVKVGFTPAPVETTTEVQIPGPPTDVSISIPTNISVEVFWNVPDEHPDLAMHYIAQATCLDCAPGSNVTVITKKLSASLSNLQPYTDYRLTVSSRLEVRLGSSSSEVPFKTAIGIPGSPMDCTIENITTDSVIIKWRPPEISNGPITKYKVTWSKIQEDELEPLSKGSEIETNSTIEQISGLSAYQKYVFWVSARTEAGWGPMSDNVTVTTDVGIPGPPIDVTIENITSKSLIIKWRPPKTTNGPIIKYKVTWSKIHENKLEPPSKRSQIETIKINEQILGLSAYQEYVFWVNAETEAGLGPNSDNVTVTTDIGIPTPPENVKTAATNTSISLTWDPPMYPKGPLNIIKYFVAWSKISNQNEISEEGSMNETSYEIKKLLPFTQYELQVCAQNRAGRSAWTFPVAVKTDVGIPGPPTNMQAKIVTNISMIITWSRPSVDTGLIEMYKVYWNTKPSTSKPIERETKNLQLKIVSLTPFTDYEVKATAKTLAGWGLWSDIINVTTAIGVPGPPVNVKLTDITNVTITVTWSPPSIPNGPILGYAIFWNESSTPEVIEDKFVTGTNVKLKDLHPYRTYCFAVSAKTSVDFGPKSQVICGRTDVGIPGIPQNPKIESVTNISAVFTWKVPQEDNGPITNYSVLWKRKSSIWRQGIVVQSTSVNISGLHPYEMYCFIVSARTLAGSGRFSEMVCRQTEIGIPEEPKNFQPTGVKNNSIILQWEPPSETNGPILKYSVRCNQDTSENVTELETNETSIVIRDLLPFTQYKLSVRAATEKGWGAPSNDILVRTYVAVPEPAKMEKPKVLSSKAIQVIWVVPSQQYPGPTEFNLEVWKKPHACRQYDQDKLVRLESESNLWGLNLKTVTGLTPHTSYFFKVYVNTTAGGTFSNASPEVTTWPDVPGPPLNLKVDCTQSPTSARVTFNPPDPPHGDISGYRITYSSKSAGDSVGFAAKEKCGPQIFLLQGLSPELPYWISIQAKVEHVNEYGYEARYPSLCTLPAGIPPVTNEASTEISDVNDHELRLRWSRKLFSSDMGKVLYYAVIVGEAEVIGPSLNGSLSDLIEFPPWLLFENGTTRIFQATPPNWNPFEDFVPDTLNCERDDLISDFVICVLGRNLNCSNNEYNYCNGPLLANTEYGIKIRGFTKGGYSESQAVFAKTKSLPGSGAYGGLIAGIIVLVAFLTAAMCAFLVFKKHPERWKHIRRALPLFQKGPSLQFTMESAPPSAPSATEVNLVAPFSKQFELKDFLEHVKMMMLDSSLRFSLEFDELKLQSPRWKCTSAEMEENRPKNRWMNIFPFDHSRVKLLPIDDEPGSDFVNASFIPGFNSQREYIASQGPLKCTVDDFWRMIWEQNVAIIVMLTLCVERGKNKCEQYWPSGSESQQYGDLKVQMLSESILESYIIRIFVVQLGSRERRIKQMHFTRWPDFGSPEKPHDLINFVRATREHMPRSQKGPILVHCSAGVGRTGTFITVDRLMQHLQQHQQLDVYETVLEMRQHRTNMVQTEDQYIYIHKCMREIILEKLKPPIETVEGSDGIYSNMLVQKDTKV